MSKKNEAEVRERAEAFRGKYPDHYKPMDTLGYVADANGIIRDLLTLLDSKQELLDEKDKVIDRLPKTADGVPVTPGMNLYAPNVDYDFGALAIVSDSDRPQIECRDVRGVEFGMCASLCYSTREAAEAEKENEDE